MTGAADALRDTSTVYLEYLEACARHRQTPDPWVAIGFYVRCPEIRASRTAREIHLVPIVELCLSKQADFVERIHLPGMRLSHVSALLLAELVRSPGSRIKELDLSWNKLGNEGVSVLAAALAENDVLEVLDLSRNKIGPEGAAALSVMLGEGGASSLKRLDMFGNLLGIRGVTTIAQCCAKRNIYVNDEGNHIVSETLNGFTHGLGLCASVSAGGAMIAEAREYLSEGLISLPLYVSIYVFVLALCGTFGSSSLSHSAFRFRGNIRRVLQVLDHCSIFVLIAGTYTPFLFKFAWAPSVHGPKNIWIGPFLFIFVWVFAAAGILLSSGVTRHTPSPKVRASLSLGMGWLIMMSMPIFWLHMGRTCLGLIALGSVFYTVGVPFYLWGLRKPMFHVYWHCWVMLGAFAHYLAVLMYVLRYPPIGPEL